MDHIKIFMILAMNTFWVSEYWRASISIPDIFLSLGFSHAHRDFLTFIRISSRSLGFLTLTDTFSRSLGFSHAYWHFLTLIGIFLNSSVSHTHWDFLTLVGIFSLSPGFFHSHWNFLTLIGILSRLLGFSLAYWDFLILIEIF